MMLPFRRSVRLCWLMLTAMAQAQTLVPLDSRPATSTLPAAIASLGMQAVHVPPRALLGTARQGADYNQLLAWLQAQPTTGPLIVSLDALAYGGLVQSRTSTLSASEVLARLAPLRERAKQQPIYAFITLPRSPDATDRARNLAIARQMMHWAADGTFTELHVTWDDALPASPAPQEGAELAKDAPPNVQIYPGTDEVLSSLVARALAPKPSSVQVEYSDPVSQDKITKYDGIALSESVRLHAQAAGYEVRSEQSSPLILYIYNGGEPRKSALRISALLRQAAKQGRWVAVADVNTVNMGNSRLWADLTTLRRTPALAALAAWGTPGNNIGTALAHSKVVLAGADPLRQDALLAREYTNDVLYSGLLRAELRKAVPDAQLSQPGGLQKAEQVLYGLAQQHFPLEMEQNYTLQDVTLPWQRSFEWDFRVQQHQNQ